MKNLLRRLAWWIIRKTSSHDQPQVVYTHACGSESVIPLGKFFSGWKEPAFECLGCACITNKDITARLVDPKDQKVQLNQRAGRTILHTHY